MYYATVAKFNREQSLRAMWQALRARHFADQQRVENDAGVVGNLLNARYYDSTRGQLVSQDPVVWATAKQQNLQGPQSLNSFSYANDNPINVSRANGSSLIGRFAAIKQRPLPVQRASEEARHLHPSGPDERLHFSSIRRPGARDWVEWQSAADSADRCCRAAGRRVDSMRYFITEAVECIDA
jgi:RHS repeat-associated protein